MGAEHIWEGKVARCADCIYFDNGKMDDLLGMCRQMPPEAGHGHPTVSKECWCGLFQPIDQNQGGSY